MIVKSLPADNMNDWSRYNAHGQSCKKVRIENQSLLNEH